jgi:hypothetical protein
MHEVPADRVFLSRSNLTPVAEAHQCGLQEVHLREWFGAKETHRNITSVAGAWDGWPESIGISGLNETE